jgi:hypothetical protein
LMGPVILVRTGRHHGWGGGEQAPSHPKCNQPGLAYSHPARDIPSAQRGKAWG